MTRQEFEAERRLADKKYKEQAEQDILAANGRIHQNNALRRKDLALRKMELWGNTSAQFWTEENELAFSMIYQHLASGPVSFS